MHRVSRSTLFATTAPRGPEPTVFGCYVPCAPIQKAQYRSDLLWEVLRFARAAREGLRNRGNGRMVWSSADLLCSRMDCAQPMPDRDTFTVVLSDSNCSPSDLLHECFREQKRACIQPPSCSKLLRSDTSYTCRAAQTHRAGPTPAWLSFPSV